MEKDFKTKNDKIKKALMIIFRILYQILVIFCLILTAIIILQKVTNSNKSIAGYRIFRVITGSMEPEYDVGEVVISKEMPPKDIKVGDDIVYLGTYGDYNGKIIMHKVVAIDEDEKGNLTFHAKGLHSASVEDPQIKENQIYGVVKIKSKLLTVLYELATNIYTLFVIIIILVLNVFISFRSSNKKEVNKLQESNKSNEDIEYTDSEEIEDDEIEEDTNYSEEDDDDYEEYYESEDDIYNDLEDNETNDDN